MQHSSNPSASPAAPLGTGRIAAGISGKAIALLLGIGGLTLASFYTLNLQVVQFASADSLARMGRFIAELLSPDLSSAFVSKVLMASLETLAMSGIGTLLAVFFGLALALPASQKGAGLVGAIRGLTKLAFNGLRSIPELVWAALLLIFAGLGPFAGTLALALHTTGVFGRLFSEAIENAPDHAAVALRSQGISELRVFLYATLPTILPQLVSYSLYRWENNIRAAAVLGVVGAGGLGQMLAFHMGLFHMNETSTILLAMIALVMIVDGLSYLARQRLSA
jgi:phosphonate transport system permease protein